MTTRFEREGPVALLTIDADIQELLLKGDVQELLKQGGTSFLVGMGVISFLVPMMLVGIRGDDTRPATGTVLFAEAC